MQYAIWYTISCFVAGGLLVIITESLRDILRMLAKRADNRHHERMAQIEVDRVERVWRCNQAALDLQRIDRE